MDKLTAKEKAWIAEVNEVLARCPSKRLGFYTIGDPQVEVFLIKHQEPCDEQQEDLPRYLSRVDGVMTDATMYFPSAVNGVCG